jgi:hypothetical protein
MKTGVFVGFFFLSPPLAFVLTTHITRMLLWHGSRLTNWVGILSTGLRIAPPEAPKTGYRFGKGGKHFFFFCCAISLVVSLLCGCDFKEWKLLLHIQGESHCTNV